MYKYTLGFILRQDEVLMINREKKPWHGAWNGLGGKINDNETPKECLIREIYEETGIKVASHQVYDRGIVTWNLFDAQGQGLYLFLIKVDPNLDYPTPRGVDEGILDWKKISWIMSLDNYGVAHNIFHFLLNVINQDQRFCYHCIFEGRNLINVQIERMD
jgi:8-oxo-dGTP diphosphatase